MFMPYMYCLIVINVNPIYCTLRRAVGVTVLWSLVAPCHCDNLWCRGVVIVTAPLCLMYRLKRTYICRVSDENTRTDTLFHWCWGKMADIPQQTTFSNVFLQWKLKYLEKWSKFQHGIRYWLGAFQATSHCLNQYWHSSSVHIYFSRRDWV